MFFLKYLIFLVDKINNNNILYIIELSSDIFFLGGEWKKIMSDDIVKKIKDTGLVKRFYNASGKLIYSLYREKF